MKHSTWIGWCFIAATCAPVAPQSSSAQEELIELIVGFLADEDKEVRALAYEQIRTEAEGEMATKAFAAQLPKLSADAQVGLLSALADRGDRAAGPAVIELVDKSQDAPVKLAAIQATGRLGKPDDHPLLVKILGDGSEQEQSAARDALVKLGDKSVSKAIAEELGSLSTDVQVALLDILTTRRAINAIPEMLRSATGDNVVVRGAAMKALAQLASSEHVAGMIDAVLKAERGRERAYAEIAVATVCGRIEDVDKRAEPVLTARKQLGRAEQLALLSLVGRVGGAPALRVVEAAIAHDDPSIRELGLRALFNWPDASIEARLLELARVEKRPDHRRMALRTLIRVATVTDDRTDQHRLDILRTAIVMSQSGDDRKFVLQRAQGIRTVASLRFVLPFLEQPKFAETACLTVVELAHHRKLREPNKAEFDKVLDKVIATSQDEVVKDRAQRYKKDQTWVRPGAE